VPELQATLHLFFCGPKHKAKVPLKIHPFRVLKIPVFSN